jgi:hypothetical protein
LTRMVISSHSAHLSKAFVNVFKRLITKEAEG